MGNLAALRHGARSRQVAGGLLEEQAEAVAMLAERRQQIEDDLGGASQLSALTRDHVTRYLELSMIADYLAANIQELGVLTGKGRTRAAVSAYLQVVDRQTRLGQSLGLERRAKRVPTVDEFLASRAAPQL